MAGRRVGLTGDVIVSAELASRATGVAARTAVVVDGYGDHEIANPLMGIGTYCPLAQALVAVGEADSLVVRPRAPGLPLSFELEMSYGTIHRSTIVRPGQPGPPPLRLDGPPVPDPVAVNPEQ